MMDPNLKNENITVPEKWNDGDLGQISYHHTPSGNYTFVTKFFFISLLIFIFAAGLFLYSFVNNKNSFSENKIAVSAFGPGTLTSGEEGEITVSITNNNSSALQETYLLTTYNSGQSSTGNTNLETNKLDIGEIPAMSSITKTFRISIFGAEGTSKDINPVLHYKISKSKAEFNKSANTVSIILKASPVAINVESLKEMHQNHPENFKIIISNNTANEIKNLIVSMRPPNDFVYSSSSLPLYNNNPSWIIKSLPANSKKEIDLSGKLIGQIGTSPTFTFFAGVSDRDKTGSINSISSTSLSNFDNFNIGIDNVYSKLERNILIGGQYLDVNILSDNSEGQNITPGEILILEFNYKNNLSYPIENVFINAKIIGDSVDLNNTQANNGYVDSTTHTVVWDKNTMAELSRVSPNYEGKLRLQLKIKNNLGEANNLKIIISAGGERNSEDSVSNYQDISLEKSWNIVNN